MVAARVHGKLYVVFGNRRLKALKEACLQGMLEDTQASFFVGDAETSHDAFAEG